MPCRVCSTRGLYPPETLQPVDHCRHVLCDTAPGRDRLQKGLADSRFGVVHAVPSAQLGRGVVESHLRFRHLDLTQFLQHLCALGKDMSVLDVGGITTLSSEGEGTLHRLSVAGTDSLPKPKVQSQLPCCVAFLCHEMRGLGVLCTPLQSRGWINVVLFASLS